MHPPVAINGYTTAWSHSFVTRYQQQHRFGTFRPSRRQAGSRQFGRQSAPRPRRHPYHRERDRCPAQLSGIAPALRRGDGNIARLGRGAGSPGGHIRAQFLFWLVYDLALLEIGAESVAFTDDFKDSLGDEILKKYDVPVLLTVKQFRAGFQILPRASSLSMTSIRISRCSPCRRLGRTGSSRTRWTRLLVRLGGGP